MPIPVERRNHILTATEPIVGDEPPIIVTGLSRSGSSLLAHVASALPDWYVFDDMAPLQKAHAVGAATGPLADGPLTEFVERLHVVTRVRVILAQRFAPPSILAGHLPVLAHSMRETFVGRSPTWAEVTREWVGRLAMLAGKSRWGYQSGSDFLHLDRLHAEFPGALFVFNTRDPRAVMLSYKNLAGSVERDGDPDSYHPVVYARYWRTAEQAMRAYSTAHPAHAVHVAFEDLIADPTAIAAAIADRTATAAPTTVDMPPKNTSLSGSVDPLSPTEVWLCERIAGVEIARAGYELSGASPEPGDVATLAAITARFGRYNLQRIRGSADAKQRVANAARAMLGR